MGDRLCPSHYCQPPGFKMLSTPLLILGFKTCKNLLIFQDAPILVMLNPKSGKGDSQSMFEKTLMPLMEEFALSYELFVTKRAKEAEDYLQRFVSLN